MEAGFAELAARVWNGSGSIHSLSIFLRPLAIWGWQRHARGRRRPVMLLQSDLACWHIPSAKQVRATLTINGLGMYTPSLESGCGAREWMIICSITEPTIFPNLFFFFLFFGRLAAHEVLRPGIRSELQLRPKPQLWQTPDPWHSTPGRELNLCPSAPKTLLILLHHSGNSWANRL